MNVEQAKKLSLPDLLARFGHQPAESKKSGYELWYCSPFREETKPSFHTSYLNGKWIWNDFGDVGGTVIDFVMRYKNYSQVKDALTFLEGIYQPNLFDVPTRDQQATSPLFSFQPQEGREAAQIFFENRELEFIDARPLKHFVALKYLTEERGIPAELAQHYLCLVRYRNLSNGKEYFGIGMKNEAGGFEVRSASSQQNFKSALLARDISIIPGTDPQHKSVSIFEGMTDFLSLLVMRDQKNLPEDTIVLHSLSSYRRAADAIQARGYEQIKTYLDNNKAGQEGTERFKAEFGARVFSQSSSFAPHIDLNDALQKQRSVSPRYSKS